VEIILDQKRFTETRPRPENRYNTGNDWSSSPLLEGGDGVFHNEESQRSSDRKENR